MKKASKPDYGQLERLIQDRESFIIIGATKRLRKYCSELEEIVEAQDMTCRIYTKGRTWVMGAAALVTWGATAALQAGHSLMTKNPDWKIGRDIINNSIEVKYRTDFK